MRKRFYIIFVAREEDGRLRKIPVPLHYAYIFVAAAIVGAFTITGMAGSYSRMLLKTASFNQVRSQREALRKDYAQLEQVAHEKEVQAASLGSLANEVSALYGLRQNKLTAKSTATAAASVLTDNQDSFSQQAYSRSLDQLGAFAAHGSFRTGLSTIWSRCTPSVWQSGRYSEPRECAFPVACCRAGDELVWRA